MEFNKYDNGNSPQKEFVPDYAEDYYGGSYRENYNGYVNNGYENGYANNGYENSYVNNGYENGYANNGYENSYVNNGYENGYANNGYENGYANNGYENGYANNGYENGYVNNGYENGYVNNGYENGYANNSYENSYANNDYENGYANNSYENSYANNDYENGYANNGYENGYANNDYENGYSSNNYNDFLDDYGENYQSNYETNDSTEEADEDYSSFINNYEGNDYSQIDDTQQLLEEYEKPAPKRKPPAKPKVLWARVFFALFVVIIALLICIFVLSKIISGVAGIFFKQTPKKTTVEQSSVYVMDSSENAADSQAADSQAADSAATAGNYMYDQLVILLDAGHGGNDDGAVLEPENSGDPIRKEKDDNFEICQKIKLYLEGMNVKVIMTREDDTYVSPGDRCRIANDQQVDFLVSVHRNSLSEPMQGVETWVHNERPTNDTELANHIMYYLEKTGHVENSRGVNYGYRDKNVANNFMVNASSKMPSCLIELGFITDKNDNHLFDTYKDDYAFAIAQGIFEAAKDLKVVDEDGKRIMNEQLSTNKYVYPIDDDSGFE